MSDEHTPAPQDQQAEADFQSEILGLAARNMGVRQVHAPQVQQAALQTVADALDGLCNVLRDGREPSLSISGLREMANAVRQAAQVGPQGQQAEAVAWLYERRGFKSAVSLRKPDYADLMSLQPLFAHPAPQAEAAPSRDEALRAEVRSMVAEHLQGHQRCDGPVNGISARNLRAILAALEDRT